MSCYSMRGLDKLLNIDYYGDVQNVIFKMSFFPQNSAGPSSVLLEKVYLLLIQSALTIAITKKKKKC